MTDPTHTRRRFSPTPGWLVFALLVLEGLLWLSGRFQWFGFNHHKGWTVLIAVAVVGMTMLVMLGWFIVARVFRRRFQFSIRSLLVLTVAVALPFSWLAVEVKRAREQEEAAAIYKLGGNVWFDYQIIDGCDYPDLDRGPPRRPTWLLGLLGNDFFAAVVGMQLHRSEVTDADLEQIRRLPQLKWLDIGDTNTTDAGLENFKELTQLEVLGISGTKVTDAGVEALQKALPKCKISCDPLYRPGSIRTSGSF